MIRFESKSGKGANVVKSARKSLILAFSILLMATTLTSCSKAEESTQMFADVILLDISSGLNAAGSFNSEDHSVTSLSSRAQQLRQKLSTALGDRHAVYFGFVRKTYGQQQIETLISPKLIQLMDKTLEEDVKDPQLRKDARDGILGAWRHVIIDNPKLAESENCQKQIGTRISSDSNGSITDIHASQLASSLCSNAQSANSQINGLSVTPENIGSEIQAAVDRSIEKLSSDERRLVNSQGRQIFLIPTIILVSDLIQVTNGTKIIDTLNSDAKPSDACERARSESENYEVRIENMVLISDGFASTKGNINTELRDKLREYWKCWLETRGITDIDLGTRGINLGDI
jgi:hypothetical protein